MSDEREQRWVNAVIEIVVPLHVPIDAKPYEKQEAAGAVFDEIEMPDSAVAVGRWVDASSEDDGSLASRLAEAEAARDAADRQAVYQTQQHLAALRDLERARKALHQAGIRLAQCRRDRAERDKVFAQAQTGMNEIDMALRDLAASSPTTTEDRDGR